MEIEIILNNFSYSVIAKSISLSYTLDASSPIYYSYNFIH